MPKQVILTPAEHTGLVHYVGISSRVEIRFAVIEWADSRRGVFNRDGYMH